MTKFTIHESHRVERLAEALAQLFDDPRGGPLEPEAVVVPGRGMSVWLSMELSKTLGVWAAPFSYPRALVERVARAALGEGALGPEPLGVGLIEWCVHATLPTLLDQPAFSRLRHYLEGDEHGVRLAEVSARIATVFDQYLTYRPLWIRAWEGGGFATAPEGERWQAILWQRVATRLRCKHVAHVEEPLLARLADRRPIAGLPPRVSLFGLSTLPPLYVRVLVALSRHVDVHLFRFAPSVSSRAVTEPFGTYGVAGAELRTVLEATLDRQGIDAVRARHFDEPPLSTLLGALQRRLVDATAELPSRVPLEPAGDASISVHSCHGPMREVEVLHDQLLALLTRERDPVAPEDVVVLVSNVEAYASLIEAVFRRDPSDPRFIPFRVADRSARRESAGFDAFLRVLALVRGRVTAADVSDLLSLDSVRARLGVDAQGVDRLRQWIVESGIRWGLDGAHLASLGLPKEGGQTWEFGLRRLLLGYAMPSRDTRTFGGVLGYDEVEGKDAALLGVLAELVRSLGVTLRDFETPRALPEWTVALGALARELFGEDAEGAREIAGIHKAIDGLGRVAAAAGFAGKLDASVVYRLLERQADELGSERGFLSGGVTFSAMVPMRSIPFRVVALLGMNDGDFPRSPRPAEFDLMQSGVFAREEGDRSPRDDDRQLFLETLFAAKERLIVTYSGMSVRDNRHVPPSIALGELLEALTGAGGAEGQAARQSALVVEHKLQAYSPAYFDGRDPRLFSYRSEYERAAESLLEEGRDPRPFLDAKGLDPFPLPPKLELGDLLRFWKSPATYLLNRRLGIYLRDRRPPLAIREPLELDNLASWAIATPLMEELLVEPDTNVALVQVARKLRASGRLPVGGWGQALLEAMLPVCLEIVAQVVEHRGVGNEETTVPLDVPVAGSRLVGNLGGLFGGRLVLHRYSTVRPYRKLELWLQHLALCAAGLGRGPSVRIGRDGDKVRVVKLSPLEPAAAVRELEGFVELYVRGQSRPLPFLPEESFGYYDKLHPAPTKRKSAPATPRTAIASVTSSYEREGMKYDPHPDRAFDARLPPFDAKFDLGERAIEDTEFHALAERICAPYAAHLVVDPR
jgi:exodeoxyribonuclease V gamma subunit